MNAEIVLETKELTKKFPGVLANDSISIQTRKGEIRAIMGENGAGKSTFCNMITGVLAPTFGEIFIDGKAVEFTHPRDALAVGIRMVYQERNLIEFLTGAQSICLGLEDRRRRLFVDDKKMQERAVSIRKEIGIDIPLNIPVSRLSPAQQQMIEIMRAVVHEPKLLILDEPTASLGSEEVNVLFRVMRQLKEKGVSIVLITHKLEEVFEISDSISVFRNGKHISTVNNGEIDRIGAVKLMLGRDMKMQFPEFDDVSMEENILDLKNFSDGSGKINHIDFSIKKGEVVGIYGLLGSGRTEFLETLFGLRNRRNGTMKYLNEDIPNKIKPKKMIDKGMILIPEDRRNTSIFKDSLNLKQNATLGYLDLISNKWNLINRKKENELFNTIADNPGLRLSYHDSKQSISQLSGGNQQKVVLGRWIFKNNLKLLLLDEPTQGIDVGVKHDIYILIRDMAKKGISSIIISSELPELTGVCDRLYVLKDGEFKASLQKNDFNDEKILEMIL